MSKPMVTVVIPARDEVAYVAACLEAVAAQDYPTHLIEVLLVDGDSADGTPEKAKALLGSMDFGASSVLSNPVATTPTNLNVGLRAAAGAYVCRIDARSRIPHDYISRCLHVLESSPGIAVVGGAQIATPEPGNNLSVGIARALNNRWSMGGSRYRRRAESGTCETVYLGFFRTAQVRSVGGWDETLPTNQDFELNQRMAQHGDVWFQAHLPVGYIPRADLGRLWHQYVRFGRWKVRYWRRGDVGPERRQLALIAALPLAVACMFGISVVAPRWLRWLPFVGVASLFALEVNGSEMPDGGFRDHVVAAAAMLLVTVGWSCGVWREIIAPAGDLSGHDMK